MCIRFVSFNDCSIGFWNCFDSVLFSVFHLVVRQPLHGLFQKLLTIPEHMMSSIFWLGLYCCVFFCVVFCWTLFAFLPLFSYPLCCLFSIYGFWLILLVSPKLLLCSCINNIFSSHCGHSNGNYLFTSDFLFLVLIFKKNIEHKFICLQQ
jgi:hypothetical protein